METGLKISIDILCSQFAILMFAGLQDRRERDQLDYRLFVIILIAIETELAADAARFLTDGATTRLGQAVLRNAVFVLYAASPLATMVYAIYVEYLTFTPNRRPRKRLILYALPAAAIMATSFASIFTGWLFAFDGEGRYVLARFSYLSYVVPCGYLACALIVASRRRRTMSAADFASLVSFPVPMGVLGVVQSLMPGYVVLLPGYVLSLLVLFVNIQERRLARDHLTGAYNRRRLDEFLGGLIDDARRSRGSFAAFLADVNDFKLINDRFGHDAGDSALVEVVRIMKSGLRRDDFLARYAGDEFVAVMPGCGPAELGAVVARIHGAFEAASGPDARYALSISMGAAVFDPALDPGSEGYIKRLDALMYERKRARKEGGAARGRP